MNGMPAELDERSNEGTNEHIWRLKILPLSVEEQYAARLSDECNAGKMTATLDNQTNEASERATAIGGGKTDRKNEK